MRQKRFGQYAESSSKTLIGLQKVNVQLQKEIDSIEKQKKTAVNNIANHQQALKMSWRRLEQQRNVASSPLQSRATTAPTDGANPRQLRKGILQSNTRLYVAATPQVYDSIASSPSATQLTVTSAEQDETENHSAIAPGLFDNKYSRSSPYISSPFTFRKEALLPRMTTPSSLASEDGAASDGRNSEEGSSTELKLPGVASKTQKAVPIGKIVDKQALMEASMLLGVDGTSSKGPGVFQNFYNPDANVSVRRIVVTPATGESGNEEDEQKQQKKEDGQPSELGASSEPSLAEMFEQIKHCRYIRHYRPDGTEIEEYA